MTVIDVGLSRGGAIVPLQSVSAPSDPAELLVLAGGVLTIAIGIAIAVIAFRGYRSNDSRSMLFIAVGFVLAIAFPGTIDFTLYVLIVAFQFQLPVDRIYLAGFLQGTQLLGMAAILYALLMD
ncbi:MAG: hypothetical protein ACOCY1_04060 [Halovenus sp.]